MLTQLREHIHAVFLLSFLISFFNSCTEKEPLPTATIKTKIDGNIVEFTVEAENAETFQWDFGDGSPGSSEENPVHVFGEFGKEYTVMLKIGGPGGETIVTQIIRIPEMTPFEMLTGGKGDEDGKSWKIKSAASIIVARADASFTTVQVLPQSWLNNIGFLKAYTDKYVFKANGDYRIVTTGPGVIAGLSYSNSKNIPNTPPGLEAQQAGLTLINQFTVPEGLKFSFSESGTYNFWFSDGSSSASVSLSDVMILTFSKGGFLGISNWVTESVITSISPTEMKVALFASDIPPGSPYSGMTSKVFILPLEPAE